MKYLKLLDGYKITYDTKVPSMTFTNLRNNLKLIYSSFEKSNKSDEIVEKFSEKEKSLLLSLVKNMCPDFFDMSFLSENNLELDSLFFGRERRSIRILIIKYIDDYYCIKFISSIIEDSKEYKNMIIKCDQFSDLLKKLKKLFKLLMKDIKPI